MSKMLPNHSRGISRFKFVFVVPGSRASNSHCTPVDLNVIGQYHSYCCSRIEDADCSLHLSSILLSACWYGALVSRLCLLICLVVQAQVTNYFTINNKRYATLDNASPTVTDSGCQVSPLTLPSGWSVASAEGDAVVAAMSYNWATTCVIFADGSSVFTRLGTSCGTGLLSTSGSTYVPVQCNRRIFITQTASGTFILKSHAVSVSDIVFVCTIAASDVDFSSVLLTNYIVFRGTAYAVLDNTPPSETSQTCQPIVRLIVVILMHVFVDCSLFLQMKRLPTGWSVATDNRDTCRAAWLAVYCTLLPQLFACSLSPCLCVRVRASQCLCVSLCNACSSGQAVSCWPTGSVSAAAPVLTAALTCCWRSAATTLRCFAIERCW